MAKKKRGVHFYKSYRFTGQDPAIGEVFNLAGKAKTHVISKNSGVSDGTIGNWRNGKTRRPQNATIEAVGRALGYKRQWVRK